MKILKVKANNRRHAFEIETRSSSFVFPYSKADPEPSAQDKIAQVYVDPEMGREAFTYELASGAEGTVHIDDVLEYNEDPAYLADLAIHKLTVDARAKFDASSLSVRELARRLRTSPAQLYRLLDPANYSKSAHQLVALLSAMGYDVEVGVRERT